MGADLWSQVIARLELSGFLYIALACGEPLLGLREVHRNPRSGPELLSFIASYLSEDTGELLQVLLLLKSLGF